MKKQIITTIRSDELRTILGISKSTYYRMIRSGRLPKPTPVSDRVRIFDVKEVEETLGFTLTGSYQEAH